MASTSQKTRRTGSRDIIFFGRQTTLKCRLGNEKGFLTVADFMRTAANALRTIQWKYLQITIVVFRNF